MKVVTQVVDTLIGEVPIVVSPCELFLNVASGFQGGQSLDDVQIRDLFKFWMLGSMVILFGHHYTLLEEVLVDSTLVLLGHQHSVMKKLREIVKIDFKENVNGRKLRKIIVVRSGVRTHAHFRVPELKSGALDRSAILTLDT